MRKQMVIDPPSGDGRLRGNCATLRQSSDPAVQIPACRSDLAFLVHMASRVLHAIADRLLVYIEADETHSL
jgi:hypothetical protein